MKSKENENNNEDNNEVNKKGNEQNIKEELSCVILKSNYIDNPDLILGYPLLKNKRNIKNKINIYIIPELISFEGFMEKLNNNDFKLDYYYSNLSPKSDYYYYWIPMYIDECHYLKAKNTIFNIFSLLEYGINMKEYDFYSEIIFEHFPLIINKILLGIINKDTCISSAFIKCYFHFIILLNRLSIEFKDNLKKYLNHILNQIYKNNYIVTESIIPIIGNFIILLLFANININNKKMKRIWVCLFEELFIRQINNIFIDNKKVKEFLMKIILNEKKDNNEYLKNILDTKKEFYKKIIKPNKISFSM